MDRLDALISRKITLQRLCDFASVDDMPDLQAVYAFSAARLEYEITAYILMAQSDRPPYD